MFGFHDRKDQGYLGNLRDRGHELFYHNDPSGNVTDLTDHLGSEVLKYRYDAFGGVFTQLWTPYNQVGLTGKSYDIKASLMDYSARWYSTSAGRFTTQDTWQGLQSVPQTQNRYAYALNNPINITDPSGHAPCYEDDDGSVHCGYGDPENYPVIDPGSGGDSDNGGGYDNGGGGYDNGGGDNGGVDPEPPWWMNLQQRMQDLYSAAGQMYGEIHNMSSSDIEDLILGLSSAYADNGTFGLVNAFNVDESLGRSEWYYRGRVVGDSVSMVTSTGLINLGETGVGLGLGEATFTASTVIAAPAAGPGLLVAGAGALAAGYGTAMAGHSAESMSKDAQLLYSKSEKNSNEVKSPYKRPSGSVTKAQRESVQGKPCVTCGADDGGKRVADHKKPLVEEYYGTGKIDKQKMRDVESVQPQCPTCSARQGAEMSQLPKK